MRKILFVAVLLASVAVSAQGIQDQRGSGARDIGIVAIGDSHTAGEVHTVTVSGSEQMGASGLSSPLDEFWTGSAVGAFWPVQDDILTGATSEDPNTLNPTNLGSYMRWIAQSLRLAYPQIRRIRIANLGLAGASSYSWAGAQDSGYLSADANASVGETIEVNHPDGNRTYTFVAAAASAGQVTIGGSAVGTAQNLARAINAEGAGFGAGTTKHPGAWCPVIPGGALFRVSSKKVGSASGLTLFASSGGHISLYQAASGGASVAGAYTEALSLVPAGFGRVDVVLVMLGTNDAVRAGYRAEFTGANMISLVAQLRASFPGAKIVVGKPPVHGDGTANARITDTVLPALSGLAVDGFADLNMLGAGSAGTAILSADGVHLTNAGYQIAASLWAKAIAQALSISR